MGSQHLQPEQITIAPGSTLQVINYAAGVLAAHMNTRYYSEHPLHLLVREETFNGGGAVLGIELVVSKVDDANARVIGGILLDGNGGRLLVDLASRDTEMTPRLHVLDQVVAFKAPTDTRL